MAKKLTNAKPSFGAKASAKKAKAKQKEEDTTPRYKLRIDGRTVITVKSKEALKMWKEKYPNAEEID